MYICIYLYTYIQQEISRNLSILPPLEILGPALFINPALVLGGESRLRLTDQRNLDQQTGEVRGASTSASTRGFAVAAKLLLVDDELVDEILPCIDCALFHHPIEESLYINQPIC